MGKIRLPFREHVASTNVATGIPPIYNITQIS